MNASAASPPRPTLAPAPVAMRLRLLLFAKVFLVALGLRVAYIMEIWPHPAAQLPILDAEAYRQTALEIRTGDWLGDSA